MCETGWLAQLVEHCIHIARVTGSSPVPPTNTLIKCYYLLTMSTKTPFTLAILAKNEEKNIENCIKYFDGVTDDILVLDDDSTDATAPLAQASGARIAKSPKTLSFAAKRNECMRLAKYDWILFIDADERPDKELIAWLGRFEQHGNIAAYRIARMDHFWNTNLKRGEVSAAYSKGIKRLVDRRFAKFEGVVHEDVKLLQGHTEAKSKGTIEHFPHETVSEFIREINYYSSLRADELLYKKSIARIVFEMIVYPPSKFWYTYLVKGGFMDGAAGFAYSFLMAFHSFLVRAKLLAKTT